jgi:1,4-dihydroxy-2-naphthoate octaprenyltransferase
MKDVIKISTSDPDYRRLLRTGRVDSSGERYVPDSFVEMAEGKIVLFRKTSDPGPSVWKRWLVSFRAISLTATVCPLLSVAIFGIVQGEAPRLWVGLSAIIAALLLQIATNLWNDVGDFLRLIDLPGGHGGSGVLQKGWLSLDQVNRAAWIFLILAIFLGLPTLFYEWKLALGIVILGILGAALYSQEKIGLKYHVLGDLTVFLLCGPLLTWGGSLAFYSKIIPGAIELGFFFGFLACAILHANNLQDIDTDRSSGAKTLASLIGFSASRWVLLLLYLSAAASFIFFILQMNHGFNWGLLALLIPFFAVVKLSRQVFLASGTASPLLDWVRIRAAQVHLVFGLASLVVILSGF